MWRDQSQALGLGDFRSGAQLKVLRQGWQVLSEARLFAWMGDSRSRAPIDLGKQRSSKSRLDRLYVHWHHRLLCFETCRSYRLLARLLGVNLQLVSGRTTVRVDRQQPLQSRRSSKRLKCLQRVDSASPGSGGAVGGAVFSGFRSSMTAPPRAAAVRAITGPTTQPLLGASEREFAGYRPAAVIAAKLTSPPLPAGRSYAYGHLILKKPDRQT